MEQAEKHQKRYGLLGQRPKLNPMKTIQSVAFAIALCCTTSLKAQENTVTISQLSPKETAVILVDLQNDFTECNKGSLAVSGTQADYIKSVAEAVRFFRAKGFFVIATQDWHPKGHISFAQSHGKEKPFTCITLADKREQMLWPVHCVQGSKGAEIVSPLSKLIDCTVRKGTNLQYDSYSGFKDDGGEYTALQKLLVDKKINHLIVFGLAADYCVKETAIDGKTLGWNIFLVADLCRGVNEKTTEDALQEMREKEIHILDFSALKMHAVKE